MINKLFFTLLIIQFFMQHLGLIGQNDKVGSTMNIHKDPLYKDRLEIMRTELANRLKQTNRTE